ncbi:DNA cytosine methyltransferase [Paenarthrobacter ureafaciens]|uniref:DNA cytosine methyltransferase n=1 Tax=Paenarthrobacter ureafaciens TaxID=37931 RepID=UPI001FB4AC96|nr:DNA cytosine methyltransferase [Paenarthrobacter ureafaciens]UOD80319.1 DNA cytosine methyltransferase [Paenarthrobacter ureafaciens]WNZ04331.1 DNA cytosine methyltransferase [Paenarthrobacter ureafaciens]
MSQLTITDMFCGAGGSSTGLSGVPGLTVKTAMNHWARAIETHNTNHPDVEHVCADIQQVEPTLVPQTDMLWASPECTNHSVAKGKKRVTWQGALFGEKLPDEAAIKSRATMWDVPRFAEIHDYKLIITENVVDAARWIMFDAWLHAMDSLGYDHHIVYMNSMHAQLGGLPAPQSRDRMYVMFWKKGNTKPDFDKLRPLAYCPTCDETVRAMQVFKKPNERWGRYRAQYVYRCPKTTCRNRIIEPGWLPASAAIDWAIEGQRIGDREKPLAEKTMARIRAGLDKYGRGSLHLEAAGNTYDSASSGRGGDYFRIWPTEEPFRTLHGSASKGLVIDAVRGTPIITHTDDPFRTQTTSYTRGLLIPVEGREGKEASPVTAALRTQTTRNETALLMPYYGSSKPQTVKDPIGTLTTVDRYAMITLRGENAPKDVYDPLDTFAANGNHHALMGVNPPAVEDCTFRMLEPHEVTWGMAFPREYVMTGTKREMVKQAGNAVCPPNARDLGIIAAESLGVAA